MNQNEKKDIKPIPPYLPFKTFIRLIEILKDTIIPERIDSSVLLKFSGSDRAALLPALKFLNLIDKDQMVMPQLKDLVKVFRTAEWKSKLEEIMNASYAEIINGLNLSTATRKQLEEAFKSFSPAVLQKSMRFYISAAKDADIVLSSYITMRRPKERKQQRTKTKPINEPESELTPKDRIPLKDLGYKEFLLPIREKEPVRIWVPDKITKEEWENVRKMMRPIEILIEAYFGFVSENKGE